MSKLRKISAFLRKPIFEKLFKVAAISNLSKEEFMQYSKSQKAKWDEYATRQTAIDEGLERGLEKGREEGREQGKAEIVKSFLLKSKLTLSELAELSGVSEAFVIQVKKSLQ